jgi:redox-sensitive bicupin YhaK (pirin superfamily)
MEKIVHRADSRGHTELGWLHSFHSFSFGDYYDPERVHFGKLRVLNDDAVEPGRGFSKHPHNNMEIVSLPLEGALKHQDSMGMLQVIRKGEVQIMSAGTGVFHSEYNNSDNEMVRFLQIWVLPKIKDIPPRYGQKSFDSEGRHNRFQTVVSPDGREGSLHINQDAFFSLSTIDSGVSCVYTLNSPGNGLYLFVIGGRLEISGETLEKRDAIGMVGVSEVAIGSLDRSEMVCVEVPVNGSRTQ